MYIPYRKFDIQVIFCNSCLLIRMYADVYARACGRVKVLLFTTVQIGILFIKMHLLLRIVDYSRLQRREPSTVHSIND